MRTLLIVLFCGIHFQDSFCQDPTTFSKLIKYEDLVFHSSLEREHFDQLSNKNPDYLGLFLSSYPFADSLFKRILEY